MVYALLDKNRHRVFALFGHVVLSACLEPAVIEYLIHFVMPYNYQFIRNAMRRQERMRMIADYMRYTFTPAFGIVQSIGALVTLITMVLVRNNPLLILNIFFLYTIIFLVAIVISFLAWRRHKRFYKSVFQK